MAAPPATVSPPHSGFITSLHGLRGILAFWVVTFHVSPRGFGPFKVTSYGYLAVDLFFVMSGYILTHTHFGDMARLSLGASARFLVNRWWRTYPLYFACVVLAIVWIVTTGPLLTLTPTRLLVALTLLEGWAYPGLGVNAPVWSLGVEWVGYLIFPLVIALQGVISRPLAVTLILAIQALSVAFLWNSGDGLSDQASGAGALMRMTAGFLSGCLIWTVVSRTSAGRYNRDAAVALAVFASAAVLLLLPPAAVLPLLLVCFALTIRPGPVCRLLLEHPWALFLGRISFALYLSHRLVLRLFQYIQISYDTHRGMTSVCAIATAIILATILCVAVEEPSRRLGRRLMRPAARYRRSVSA